MIYEIADIFTCFVESLVTVMLFDAHLYKRDNFSKWINSICVITLTVLIYISNMLLQFTMSNMIITMFLAFAVSFVYAGDLKTKAIISVLSVLLSGVIEIFVLFSMILFSGKTLSEIVTATPLRLLGIILSKLLLFIAANLICMNRRKVISKLPTNYWILFIVSFVGVLMEMFFIFILRYSGNEKLVDTLSVLVAIFILFGFFLSLYFYEHMSEQAEELANQKLLKQQLDSQVKHVNEIILAQNQIKKVRHDLLNHMILLRQYINDGMYEKSLEYIDNLTENIAVNSDNINTGNVVIDAVVSAKQTLAHKEGIDFKYTIKVPENLQFDSSDMCVLLGNALDNAIEACEKIDENRYIKLSIVYEGNMLMCKIENSAPVKSGNFLKTTKKNPDEHGIGLSNIRFVLGKYKNTLKINYEGNVFTLTFIIFI